MDYQKMYTTLFNAITDALSQIETQNYGDAKETLISAQQKAEEMYITALQKRRAQQCRARTQSAAMLPSLAPHDSKARLRVVTTRRRFMAKPCTLHLHCAARAVIQAVSCQCRGSRGTPLAFSWGSKGAILSRERMAPLSASPARCREKRPPCEYAGNNTTQCVKTMLTGSFQAIPQTRPARAAGQYASATACCSRGKTPPPM